MRADGTGVQRLTRHEGWDGSPACTPDGQALVFYSEQDGEPRIFRINRDGSAFQATSAKAETALSPTFAPNGRLSFTVRRDGRWTIVSTRPDGSDLRVESDTARDYWAPADDPSSGRLVCYGAGPTDETSRFEVDLPGPFLAHTSPRVALPDRTRSLNWGPRLYPGAQPGSLRGGHGRSLFASGDLLAPSQASERSSTA